jgi:hypothetical protein
MPGRTKRSEFPGIEKKSSDGWKMIGSGKSAAIQTLEND